MRWDIGYPGLFAEVEAVALVRSFGRLKGFGIHLRFWHVALILAVVFVAVSVLGNKVAPRD